MKLTDYVPWLDWVEYEETEIIVGVVKRDYKREGAVYLPFLYKPLNDKLFRDVNISITLQYKNSISIGSNASAGSNFSIAVGNGACTSDPSSIFIGSNNWGI